MLERIIFNNELFNKHFNNEQTLNSIQTDYLVSLCAELSLQIYNPGHFIPPGWDLLQSYEDGGTGYRGIIYTRNLLTTNAQIIVVHRGTANVPNIIGDIQIAMGNLPYQAQSVKEFLKGAVERLTKIYKPDEENDHLDMMRYLQTITTGHSMGAILADYVGLNAHASITFENPGSKAIVQSELLKIGYPPDLIPSLLNRLKTVCQAYQAGVNIINTCNEQVGRTFRINNLDYDFKVNYIDLVDFPPFISYVSNSTYLINNTQDQHSIEKLAKYFKEGRSVIEVSNPVGFQAGYVAYLNPSNKKYWGKYMDQIWASPSPLAEAMRKKYNNDEKAFIDGSYTELNNIYEQAKKIIFSEQYPQFNFSESAENQKIEEAKNREVEDIINELTIVEEDNKQQMPLSPVSSCN